MKMEGSVGSGVLKKKSSSGCLIIKKTGLNKNSGGGLGGLSESGKEKKRARLVASDSSSSSSSSDDDESLEFMRRKVNEKRLRNGSVEYNREHDSENAGIEDSAERKRSRLDLFEFDEYDEFDGKKMRNEFLGDRFKTNDRGNRKEGGVSSSRNSVVDKQKKGPYFDGSSSGKSKGVGYSGARNEGLEDDEAHMPISLLKLKHQETAGESIRLQGKNGVLKVMVNKKKKMDFPSQSKNYDSRELKERKGSRSDDVVKKDLLVQSPVYSASKTPENRGLIVDKERSSEKEKRETKLEKVKSSSNKGSKARDSEVDGTDTVLKLATPKPQAFSSKKGVKREAERSPCPENSTHAKGKEVKEGSAKRGGSTEKQMLREKIRGMLADAGWTIDYRPRRNRDYLDAVYINPSGTAYWSIIKAYDAFKKQLEEDNVKVKANVGSPSIAPLSEDLINKLTRQTKKKIAEEMRRKRKEDAMTKSAKKSAVREAAESSDSYQSEERLSSYIKQNQKSRAKLQKVDQDGDDDLSDDSPKRKSKKVRVEKASTASKSNVVQGRTSKVIGRCTLLVRGSDRGENSDFDGYVPYSGKRTVLAWLIDSGTAKLSEKVQYMNRRRTRVMLEGWITRDGIHCGCCSKILTVSKFELHAGSKLRQPFQNIYLESGPSLLQCQIDAWNSQEESVRRDFWTVDVDEDDPDDDTCGICGDGGDLICCDSCPSTFHQICLEIKMLPSGDWHCPNCTCKFCGCVSGNVAEENNSPGDELNRCNLCEKKYHKSCSERAHAPPINSNGASFCGLKCQEIYDHLQKILGVKHELEAGISWSLIQRKDLSDASQRGFPLRVECNSKLAVALSVMDECFLPIIDRRSGINMIHNVVCNCGSNFNRLNYRGFYTAILERGDEIIAAACIRLHGDRLAEMPFIGTREIYRRQGMCRRLLSAIETELCTLKVGQLIIPAIAEHTNTWTTVFGFHELEVVHKKEIKSMNMLVFPGTDMLQKQLVKKENPDGTEVSESASDLPQLTASVEKSEASLSLEQNRQASSDSGGCLESKINDKVDALDSASPVRSIPSNALPPESDNSAPSASDVACESDVHRAREGAIAFKPDVENKQKESSDNSKCSPTPAESNNSTDKEHGSREHLAKDDSNSSVEAVVGDACKTEAACQESDAHIAREGATAIKPDVENKQKESSDDSKCSLTPAENNNSTDKEHGLPEHPAKADFNSSVEAVVGDACKTEAPCLESDAHIAGEEATAVKPDVENKQKESSDDSKCSLTPAENNNSTDGEHRLLKQPAKDDSSSSVAAVVGDACKTGIPCPEAIPDSSDETLNAADATGIESSITSECSKSANVQVNLSRSMKVSEDADPSKTEHNGCVDSVAGSVFEVSAKDANGTTNMNQNSAPMTTLPNDEESIMESNTNLDKAKSDVVQGVVQESLEPTETDKPNGENKTPCLVDGNVASISLPNDEETVMASNTDSGKVKSDVVQGVIQESVDHSETDKPNGENETPCLGDGNVAAASISSSEALAQDTATTENHIL